MCASLQGLEQKAREPAQLPERACVQTGGLGASQEGLVLRFLALVLGCVFLSSVG